MNKTNEHPEIRDIKNICETSPKTKMTKGVCDKVNGEKTLSTNSKKSHKNK